MLSSLRRTFRYTKCSEKVLIRRLLSNKGEPLPRLNIVLGPIANKYREGNLKSDSDLTMLKQNLQLVAN